MKQENIMKLYHSYLKVHIVKQVQHDWLLCINKMYDQGWFELRKNNPYIVANVHEPVISGMRNLREIINNIL